MQNERKPGGKITNAREVVSEITGEPEAEGNSEHPDYQAAQGVGNQGEVAPFAQQQELLQPKGGKGCEAAAEAGGEQGCLGGVSVFVAKGSSQDQADDQATDHIDHEGAQVEPGYGRVEVPADQVPEAAANATAEDDQE